MAKRFSVQRPLEMISEEGEKLWEMMMKRKRSRNTEIVFLSIQSVTVSSGSYNKLKSHIRTGGQHRHAGDWLQKEDPTLASISAYNAPVIWMALNPDRKRRNLQKRGLFLEELPFFLRSLARHRWTHKSGEDRLSLLLQSLYGGFWRRMLVSHLPNTQNHQLKSLE